MSRCSTFSNVRRGRPPHKTEPRLVSTATRTSGSPSTWSMASMQLHEQLTAQCVAPFDVAQRDGHDAIGRGRSDKVHAGTPCLWAIARRAREGLRPHQPVSSESAGRQRRVINVTSLGDHETETRVPSHARCQQHRHRPKSTVHPSDLSGPREPRRQEVLRRVRRRTTLLADRSPKRATCWRRSVELWLTASASATSTP